MIYVLLADSVLIIHLLFIAFVIGGGLLALRSGRAALLHLPAVCWGAYIELSGKVCPLTPLEDRLRRAGGQAGYGESFLEHYLIPIIYPPGLTRDIQFWLAGLVILLNLLSYGFVLYRRWPNQTKSHDPGSTP